MLMLPFRNKILFTGLKNYAKQHVKILLLLCFYDYFDFTVTLFQKFGVRLYENKFILINYPSLDFFVTSKSLKILVQIKSKPFPESSKFYNFW